MGTWLRASIASLLFPPDVRCRALVLLLVIAAAGSQRGRAHRGPDRRCHALLQRAGCQRGSPSAEDLRRGYLDVGTDALRSFTDSRIGSMERLARRHPGQAGAVCEGTHL
jgi:hypothetical protein